MLIQRVFVAIVLEGHPTRFFFNQINNAQCLLLWRSLRDFARAAELTLVIFRKAFSGPRGEGTQKRERAAVTNARVFLKPCKSRDNERQLILDAG